jgi:hypothetical protein
MLRRYLLVLPLLSAACLQMGGGPSGDGDAPAPPPPSQAGSDGLSYNGLSQNRLSLNRLSLNRLSLNGLDLAESGLEATAEGRDLLKYVVKCALPDGQQLVTQVSGEIFVFRGSLGFAPEWLDQTCDESCQRWVSACLLAHVNAYGVSVPISIRASHPNITTSPFELEAYGVQEGAFWGNLFVPEGQPQLRFSCIGTGRLQGQRGGGGPGPGGGGGDGDGDNGPDVDPDSWLAKRACSSWDTESVCGFELAGPCYEGGTPDACEAASSADGWYVGCSDQNDPTNWNQVITVYLPR